MPFGSTCAKAPIATEGGLRAKTAIMLFGRSAVCPPGGQCLLKAEVALSGELYCVQMFVLRLRPKAENGARGWYRGSVQEITTD